MHHSTSPLERYAQTAVLILVSKRMKKIQSYLFISRITTAVILKVSLRNRYSLLPHPEHSIRCPKLFQNGRLPYSLSSLAYSEHISISSHFTQRRSKSTKTELSLISYTPMR